jgi:hypothetical protein
MKIPRIHLLSAILLVAVSLTPLSRGAEPQDDSKWVSLFNGKDLSGWVIVNDGAFMVTNGVLRVERSMGWLRTEKQYADFVLEAQWRALETNYNSGFFVRAGLEGKPFPDNAWQVNLKESSLGSLLKGRDTVLPSKTPKFPINEWVTFRMEVRGKTLTLDVNGARAWEFNDLDADHGYIGIQAEGKSLDFHRLRVQELKTAGVPSGPD